MELQHRRKGKYRFSKASVQHDGREKKFSVDNEGILEVENEAQAQALEETGEWNRLEDEEAPYALRDKTVAEVAEYVEDIEDLDRLKELRKKESEGKNRKNAIGAVDDRIEEVKQSQQEDGNPEDGEGKTEEDGKESDSEDGEETEEE